MALLCPRRKSCCLTVFSGLLLATTSLLVWHTSSTTSIPPGHRSRSVPVEIPQFSDHSLLRSLAAKNPKWQKPPASPPTKPQTPPPAPPKPSHSEPHLTDTHRHHQPPLQSEYPENLGAEDIARWKKCTFLASKVQQNESTSSCKCHFLAQPLRDPVGLASLPGSGNTWVRGLLERATGICTGAVYCDISLRSRGFLGEHIRSGRALVVKTHSVSPRWGRASRLRHMELSEHVGVFGSAILVVRNPFHALVAEWNRKVANNFRVRTTELDSHTQAAGPEWFGNNSKWDEYLQGAVKRWQNTIKHWLISSSYHPVLVVKYEDLKKNTLCEVQRMLDFLGIKYEEEVLAESLGTGFDAFHRKHPQEEFDHFTAEQRLRVSQGVKVTEALLASSNKSHLLDVGQYTNS